MGDRGNIKIIDGSGDAIYVYGHWWGSDLPDVARRALVAADMKDAHGNRWDDAGYLSTFVVRQMDDQKDAWPGCAISGHVLDNEYPIIVLDTRDRTVRIADFDWRIRAEMERENHWTMRELASSEDPSSLLSWTGGRCDGPA